VLLDAHDSLQRWVEDHRNALELLDDVDLGGLLTALDRLHPLRVQEYRAASILHAREQSRQEGGEP
jgi:hypothetical protein